MAENKPGNGHASPFGNEKGATMADGPSSGAHNFLEDPESAAPKTGGRDFTKESRDQDALDKSNDTTDPASVAPGGPLPFANSDGWDKQFTDGTAAEVAKVPFKNLK